MKQISYYLSIFLRIVGWIFFLSVDYLLGGTVRLAWDPNLGGNIVGYHIYRSKDSGGSFSRLNTTVLVVSDYRDDSVEAGHSYFYAVSAVDYSGLESSLSQELMISIPLHDANSIGSSLTAQLLPDLKVSAGEMVILSGNSWALEGSDFHYSWAQIPNSTITLVGGDTSEAVFIAPYVTSETVLTFELTVTDSNQFSATDVVRVIVFPR